MLLYRILTYGIPALGLLLQATHLLQWLWIIKVRHYQTPRNITWKEIADSQEGYIFFGRRHFRHTYMTAIGLGVASYMVPMFVGLAFDLGHLFTESLIDNPFFCAWLYLMTTLFSLVGSFNFQRDFADHHKKSQTQLRTYKPFA